VSEPRPIMDDWYTDGFIQPGGGASPIHGWPDQPLPRREFPPGIHGANPGPSHPEPKPRYRVKAPSRTVAT
jgi:hypothetical protein